MLARPELPHREEILESQQQSRLERVELPDLLRLKRFDRAIQNRDPSPV